VGTNDDPFSGRYNTCDQNLEISKNLGAFSRNALKKGMKFTEIYKESIRYWPLKIDVSDRQNRGGVGVYFINLSKIYANVEDAIDHKNPWVELMVWCIFKYLHTKAQVAPEKFLDLKNLDLNEMEKIYYKEMSESTTGYKKLTSKYINDLVEFGGRPT
jgi:hypothetical protein